MKALKIAPEILYYDTFREFNNEFKLGRGDILITNRWLYDSYIIPLDIKAPVVFQENYGRGEPSDDMIDAIAADISEYEYNRIFAFGGGTVIDICKILSLEVPDRSMKLFTREVEIKKAKELIAIPTTCGTGSEVTNVAVAELKSLKVKMGLATDEIYADKAILIPEPLKSMPDYVFATSSIDALIHAAESYLSPMASPMTEMFSLKAISMILNGYVRILSNGGNNAGCRKNLLKDFCLASNYAGIAFGNAGCGAVHALSYSIGGAFHVPHGESNYQFFTEVFRLYTEKAPGGKIIKLNNTIAEIITCNTSDIYDNLDTVLGNFIIKKPLREYGMTIEQIDSFTESTIKNQNRLLKKSYVQLDKSEIKEIFKRLY